MMRRMLLSASSSSLAQRAAHRRKMQGERPDPWPPLADEPVGPSDRETKMDK